MDVTFVEADAENLPFYDNSFDMTVSTFGVMFTPNQKRAANEMIRVTRPGGKIAMANWTPEGFVGGLFKAIGKNVPPPAGLNPPSFWGKSDWIDETFGPSASAIMFGRRNFNFRYMSPGHFVDYFRTFYGPTHKAFLALDEMGQAQLESDIRDVIAEYNVATDGTVIIPSEYAQIVIMRS